MLFAQLWGVGGVRILTFTVIPTPFIRTSGRVGAGLGAQFERSLNTSSAATPRSVRILHGVRVALGRRKFLRLLPFGLGRLASP